MKKRMYTSVATYQRKMILLVMLAAMLASVSLVSNARSVTQNDVDNAVKKALAYLASNQEESGCFREPTYGQTVASTALAVLAFENFGHLATNDPSVDPYASVVSKGLDYLVSNVHKMQIGQKTVGNPDTNGNGYGAYWDSGNGRYPAYETPMVMMAIVASNTPQKSVTSGLYMKRTHAQLVTDAADWLAWAQSPLGGWRYGVGSADSDNSVSQWPAIGLRSAEYWGIYAPEFVKSELQLWINSSQDTNPSSTEFGGFWYVPQTFENGGIPATGAGICELDYARADYSDQRIQHAILYLNRNWESQYNMGYPYAMYAVMKGCRDATPPLSTIGGHDWYDEYAQWLVQNQQADGTWSPVSPTGGPVLNAAFGLLVLNKALIYGHYSVTVVVTDEIGNALENATLTLDTPDNRTTSNSDGISVFKNVPRGNHTFAAAKTDYDTVSIIRNITEDATIIFIMNSTAPYSIIIRVSDQTGRKLPNIAVVFDGKKCQTDANGEASFGNVTRGDYTINATQQGFEPISVSQHIYKNATIEIVLYPKQPYNDLFKEALEFTAITVLIFSNLVVGSLYLRNRKRLNKIKSARQLWPPKSRILELR
jgi:hypothetical protein